jgi:AraC-like DNA-binding protein
LLHLSEIMSKQPIVPYIRECDYAEREPWFMPERRLLDYLLIYIQEGQCLFRVDGEEYHFTSGDFCLIQPRSLNYLEGLTATRTPFAHFDIFYHAERESSFPTKAGQIDLSMYAHLVQPRLNDLLGVNIPVKFIPRNPLKFRNALLNMVECWQDRDPLKQLKAQSLAMELIISILEDNRQSGIQLDSSSPSLHWLSSYLSFHMMEPLTVQDMAKRANLSVSRFSALFKLQFGVPPHHFLLNMRINHAQELLRNSEFVQEEIAAFCGFADVHHFSKAFKSMVGLSPGRFRSNQRLHSLISAQKNQL